MPLMYPDESEERIAKLRAEAHDFLWELAEALERIESDLKKEGKERGSKR